MLLGHTTFAEQAFQDARLDAVHNIEFAETGFGLTFSTGSETVTEQQLYHRMDHQHHLLLVMKQHSAKHSKILLHLVQGI